MSHHLVRAAIEEHGAVPLCAASAEHAVDYLVTAPTRGKQDPNLYGHRWVRNGEPYWCLSEVYPATEAEEEAVR